jgi:hypothetical protein
MRLSLLSRTRRLELPWPSGRRRKCQRSPRSICITVEQVAFLSGFPLRGEKVEFSEASLGLTRTCRLQSNLLRRAFLRHHSATQRPGTASRIVHLRLMPNSFLLGRPLARLPGLDEEIRAIHIHSHLERLLRVKVFLGIHSVHCSKRTSTFITLRLMAGTTPSWSAESYPNLLCL